MLTHPLTLTISKITIKDPETTIREIEIFNQRMKFICFSFATRLRRQRSISNSSTLRETKLGCYCEGYKQKLRVFNLAWYCQNCSKCYKIGVIGLEFPAIVILWASVNVVSAVDKLPLIPNLLEVIGILFSSWFVYQYLLFKPDREELFQIINKSISEILGQ